MALLCCRRRQPLWARRWASRHACLGAQLRARLIRARLGLTALLVYLLAVGRTVLGDPQVRNPHALRLAARDSLSVLISIRALTCAPWCTGGSRWRHWGRGLA